MSTGLDMIKGSLRLIGVLADGESPTASQAQDSLSAMNSMLRTWSIDGLLVPVVVREEFSLTAGVSSKTMGSSGDFNTSRPVKIIRASIEDQSVSPTAEYPLEVITADQFAEISVKDQQAQVPLKVWPSDAYPRTTLTFWPVPSAANKAVIYSEKELTSFALNTDYDFYPGFEEAIRFNLAIRLAPEYGREASATVLGIASQSLATIRRKNIKPIKLQADPALLEYPAMYDIYRGPAQ